MPIETLCQGCGRRLRVADEHAGKLAKCPHCQALYTVPQSSVAAAWGAGGTSQSPLDPADRWQLRSPDGLTFGPVSRAELDRWLAEGRITPQSQILHEGAGQWVWAVQIYPQLAGARPFGPSSTLVHSTPPKPDFTSDTPFQPSDFSAGGINPYAPPTAAGYHPGSRYLQQHRGGAILTLSIVGFACCVLVSIAAVPMAIIDLGKMKQGTMDPSGRGLTIAGLVIGIIGLLLLVGQVILGIVAALN